MAKASLFEVSKKRWINSKRESEKILCLFHDVDDKRIKVLKRKFVENEINGNKKQFRRSVEKWWGFMYSFIFVCELWIRCVRFFCVLLFSWYLRKRPRLNYSNSWAFSLGPRLMHNFENDSDARFVMEKLCSMVISCFKFHHHHPPTPLRSKGNVYRFKKNHRSEKNGGKRRNDVENFIDFPQK